MQSYSPALTHLSDAELIEEVKRLAAREREAAAALVASLAEFDARRLYLAAGYSSLFVYCVKALGLTEDAAYFRIEAARAGRRFPLVIERLADGAVTLTAVKLLAPHLTPENHQELLDEARGRTKREVELIVARIQPRPDVPSLIRKLPTPASQLGLQSVAQAEDRHGPAELPIAAPAARDGRELHVGRAPCPDAASAALARPSTSSPRPAVVVPLAPERYKLQMTMSAETHAKLRQAQDLLRHVVPNGDVAVIFDRALTLLLEELHRTKCAAKKARAATRSPGAGASRASRSTTVTASDATRTDVCSTAAADAATSSPPPNAGQEGLKLVPERAAGRSNRRTQTRRSRYIPAPVKREVWARDGARCTFVSADGTRCAQTGFLEYHHVIPYAEGGPTTPENVRLMCRQHNGAEAERWSSP